MKSSERTAENICWSCRQNFDTTPTAVNLFRDMMGLMMNPVRMFGEIAGFTMNPTNTLTPGERLPSDRPESRPTTAYNGSSIFQTWPESQDEQFEMLSNGFNALVSTYFKLVLEPNIDEQASGLSWRKI